MSRERYVEAWKWYRHRRWRSRLAIACAFVALWVQAELHARLPGAVAVGSMVMLIAFVAYAVESVRANRLRCPRCRRLFFERDYRWGSMHNSFAPRCLNCRLPKWALKPDRSR